MRSSNQLEHPLREIGLSDKETRVYLALLSLGTGTAYRIAEMCGVKKPTVYVILEDLRKKGLVLKIPHAKKALFAPKDISEYLQEQEGRLKAVRAIVPDLQQLGSRPSSNVFFFSGLHGLTEALNYKLDSMRGKTFHSFYENLEGAVENVAILFTKWDQKAMAADISFKIIMGRKYSRKYYKDLLKLSETTSAIEIKLLKEHDYPANVSFEVGEDFVRIMNEKNLHATIIDDKQTADAMRQIFQIVWEKGV